MANIKIDNLKLFYVEFGKPNVGSSVMSFGDNIQKPLFVLATNYEEAAKKALQYAEENTENKSIVGADGSLNIKGDELIVNKVSLASNKIVW